jgi:hypothetical protein
MRGVARIVGVATYACARGRSLMNECAANGTEVSLSFESAKPDSQGES